MQVLAVIAASCLAVSQGFNVTSNVPCTETHVQYKQPNLTEPNGGYTADAMACQQTCHDMVYCDHFTWFPTSKVPGACYLYGNQAVKEASTDAISGPNTCGNETSAPVAAATVATTNDTAPLVVTDASTVAAASSDSSKGSSFPWFLILALLIVACCVCGIAYWATMTKTKKSSRSAKLANQSSDDEEEAPAAYEQQFQEPGVQMAQMQPIPMMYSSYAAVPGSYAVQGVEYQQVAPQTYYYTSQGPMLYTEGAQLAPVDYIQQPVEYVQGEVQYVVDPQMQMMPQV